MLRRSAVVCLLLGLLSFYGYCYFAAAQKSPRPVVPAARIIEAATKTTAPQAAKPKPDRLDPTQPVLNEPENVFKRVLVLPPAPDSNPPPISYP